MRKILTFIIISLSLLFSVKASHVIGGDFHIQWINSTPTGAEYHIKLRAYRDGNSGALGTSQSVGIYDAVTHALIQTVTLSRTSNTFVPLGDPCYTPDPNVVSIEENIFESSSNITLPNNPNGYYIEGQLYARNNLATNFPTASSSSMVWFAMIPDPAIGQNSSPDFDDYPNDAYFCTSSPKQFSYPITDADGDSLAYSLVEPLDAYSTANGTGAGSGGYPFYPSLTWGAGYSLANIVGGTPPMSINQTTGLITAAPTALGFFTFAIRVEEFRDTTIAQNGSKVKIGETRRDVQYISLNCTSGSPPNFLNTVPQTNQTIQIPYNYEYCKDLIFNDINNTDSVYFEWESPIFDSGAYQVNVPLDINGDQHYYYNWNGTTWNDSVVIDPNQYDSTVMAAWNIGTVAQRFCWTPQCDEVGKTFPFKVNAFSLGCDGKSEDSVLFNLMVVPPPAQLGNPTTIDITYGNNQCVNLVFEDSTVVDLLNIQVTSDIFSELSAPAEFPSLSNNYEYISNVQAPVITGVPNNASNHFAVATQFCWYPDCEHIGRTFPVQARLYSIDCSKALDDTINFDIVVKPPFDSLDVIPNVISPNGDGMNDVFTFGYINNEGERVGGVSNPCTDNIKIEIFNRWGVRIFESDDPEFEWNGKNKFGQDVPGGTYFVLVHGTYGNETVKLDQRSITVFR